ncbi:membrane metallo-endopeptidase-like 1 isoform X2 [Cataglyphis hispanica]|uniref:membrane metallo-endopeptidase-like 1 isoform X2 n=1 Tax=Cataglyphis hispanica TaxID=1086592 RepID=UPI00217FCEFA|nr:membrane metallo-endopeptidase-like 1 isoform X2 [Cataglyphis hispanica]
MRRLTLYFKIIVTIFGVNGYMYENIPCASCIRNNDDETYYIHKEFCDGCIPNFDNYGYSSLNYFLKILMNYTKSIPNEPCTDFYELICGSWDKANSLFHSKWSIKDYNEYMIYYRIKYSLEERGIKPMQQMLDATGGWPILMSEEEWNAKNYTWQKIDNNYFKLYTFSILFNISYSTDYDNLGIFVIYPSLLSYGDKLKFDTQYIYEHYNMYLNTIMKVVRAFAKNKGIRIPTKKLRNDVEDLIKFEIFLKNIIGHKKEIIGIGNKMTIAELQEYYDLAGIQHATAKINWFEKIQIASKLLGTTVDDSETVLVFNIDSLHKLANLLSDTPQHVIVNYLQWHAVSIFMGNLNKQMRDIELDLYYAYNIKLHDKIKQEQRWLKCIREFEMKNIFISSYMYNSETCSVTSIIEILIVNDLFNDIKNEMMDYIKSLIWLNNLTKNFVVEKINNISLNIGFSDCYRNQKILAQMYKELKIDDNYFTNILSIIKYRNTILKQRSFRESAHRDKNSYGWPFDLLFDNFSYDQQSNEIYIPFIFMQIPYFSSKSFAPNYGGIGSVIGQHLAYIANLYMGLYFDDYGNVKYDIGVVQALERKSECLLKSIMNNIKQYRSVTPNVTTKNLEYIQLYENLAKNRAYINTHFIGTQIAFMALEKKMSLSMLSDMQTSDAAADSCCQSKDFQKKSIILERMFFFNNAMITCGTTLPYKEDFINISTTKAQINSNLANIKGFSEAFDCPVDSPMNPKLKCKTWDKETN